MDPCACCVTGHRDIPASRLPALEAILREEIETAIDGGCCRFLSGFAPGADMLFARLVLEARETHPEISLEAALPYPGWMAHRSAGDRALLARCQRTLTLSGGYHSHCFSLRNQYMVNQCRLVIGVFDGRKKGGTANTLRYAASLCRDIRIVPC